KEMTYRHWRYHISRGQHRARVCFALLEPGSDDLNVPEASWVFLIGYCRGGTRTFRLRRITRKITPPSETTRLWTDCWPVLRPNCALAACYRSVGCAESTNWEVRSLGGVILQVPERTSIPRPRKGFCGRGWRRSASASTEARC